MKRWTLISVIFFNVVLFTEQRVHGEGISEPGKTKHPNVLMIALDDMNNWIAAAKEYKGVKTPNLDRLVSQSVFFKNAHCAAPVCNPSRVSILSGKSPASTGTYFNPDPWNQNPNLKGVIPMTTYLSRNGYHTMGAGKVYHGPGLPAKNGNENLLWDEWGTRFTRYAPGKGEKVKRADDVFAGITGPHYMFLGWGPLNDKESEQLADTKAAKWAVEKLSADYDQPFFLAVGFHRPHVPLTAPQRFFDMYDIEDIDLPPLKLDDLDDLPQIARQAAVAHFYAAEGGGHLNVMDHGEWRSLVRAYLACISYVDSCVGTVLDALEDSRYKDNTIVILWSDNGWGLGERFHWEKWGLWNDITNVPLIISTPETRTGGEICNAPVSLLDLYPTIIDMCGLPANKDLDGQSIMPLVEDPDRDWKRPAVTTMGDNNHSLQFRKWHYIHWSDGSEELYDKEKDKNEWYNLAGNPEYADLIKKLKKWLPEKNTKAFRTNHTENEVHPKQGDRLWYLPVQPGIAGKSISVEAVVESANRDGVILCHGNTMAGYALYLNDGRLEFSVMDVPAPLQWCSLNPHKTIISTGDVSGLGKMKVRALMTDKGEMSIYVNGKKMAEGKKEDGPLSIHPNGVMLVGRASVRYPHYIPYGNYDINNVFKGEITDITVKFGE